MSAEPQFNLDPNKQQRKEDMKFYAIGGLLSIGILGGVVAMNVTDSWPGPHPRTHHMKFKGEIYGDHHGSTGMPSDEHLKKFTAEHGITINK